DAQLQCTKTGQVLSDLHGKSVFDLNAERAGELAKNRSGNGGPRGKEELAREVRRLLGLRGPVRPAKIEVRGESKRDGYTIRKLVFETEPGILLPALDCVPDRHDERSRPLIKVGQASPSEELSRDAQNPKQGVRVLYLQLRGMGESAP